ncbi:MAG: DUF1707 SHOCT-like domain-containing protein [Gaiellaceae bacterium]
MNGELVRASDAERERVVALLRDHAAEGRLTLEELAERVGAAYGAATTDELDALARDLPPAPPVQRRHVTRFLFSLLGSTTRSGRIRLRRRVACLMAFGNIDLDLRQATFERDVLTVVKIGMFGAIDVYVPEGVEVDFRGLAIGGHTRANGNDPPARPGTPLVRVVALSIFAGLDVWRVPVEWRDRTWREVIKGIRRGENRELEG